MAGHFAGVDLEAKLSQPTDAPEVSGAQAQGTDTAPVVENKETSEKPEAPNLDKPSPDEKPELVDLDKLERFRWKGKDLTREELEKAYLRQEDYSRKTSQVAEERKTFQRYADNFEYDMEKVLADPNLLGEMKKVYPAQFVKIAESMLSRFPSKRDEVSPGQDFQEPNNFATQKISDLERQLQQAMSKLDEFSGWKSGLDEQVQQAHMAKAEATIDKWFDDLGKKYPEADPEIVNAKAIYVSEQLEASGKKFSRAELEKLFKSEHERLENRYADRYRAQIEKQKAVSLKSTDMGAGGGVPTTPPKRAKTIREATANYLDDIEAGRVR